MCTLPPSSHWPVSPYSGKGKASKKGKRFIFEYKHERNLAQLFFGMVRNFLPQLWPLLPFFSFWSKKFLTIPKNNCGKFHACIKKCSVLALSSALLCSDVMQSFDKMASEENARGVESEHKKNARVVESEHILHILYVSLSLYLLYILLYQWHMSPGYQYYLQNCTQLLQDLFACNEFNFVFIWGFLPLINQSKGINLICADISKTGTILVGRPRGSCFFP